MDFGNWYEGMTLLALRTQSTMPAKLASFSDDESSRPRLLNQKDPIAGVSDPLHHSPQKESAVHIAPEIQ